MGKSTRPIYWGRTVKTGRTVVGDMLQWAPRMGNATSSLLYLVVCDSELLRRSLRYLDILHTKLKLSIRAI